MQEMGQRRTEHGLPLSTRPLNTLSLGDLSGDLGQHGRRPQVLPLGISRPPNRLKGF
jgi:hypothetical protein